MTDMESKTEKELAFLTDIFIAPDWGERFATLIDENVELPKEGRAAYLESGTGGHALALQQTAGKDLKFVGTDENPESVLLANAKAAAATQRMDFEHQRLEALSLGADEFDLVIVNGSLIAPQRLRAMFKEVLRVAKPGGKVAVAVPTASSFGEFFSVYWEALHNCGLMEQEGAVERLITQLPTVSEVEELAETEGLEEITSSLQPEEFEFESGEAFLKTPLIAEFLMKEWAKSVPDESRQCVFAEIERIIDEERHNANFALTVKATLVVGRKARAN